MVWILPSRLHAASAVLILSMLPVAHSHAQTSPGNEREKALARKLTESENRIRLLQQRLERLESRMEVLAAEKSSSPAKPALASTVPRDAVQNTQPPQTQAASTVSSARPPARARPGTFEVDEEAAQRALERTLTQTGALLLPEGSFSVTPELSYTRNELSASELLEVSDPATGASNVVLSNNAVRRNEFSVRAEVKYGLPNETQLEVGVPYHYVRTSTLSPFGDASRDSGSGMGDITLGVAKTLAHEKGVLPDLIGRVAYNTGSGRRNNNRVDLDGGHRQLSAEIVALKRQDPLAFYAGATYNHIFEEDDVKPGNATILSLGSVLAASPATSLQFGFSQVHRQRQEINNTKVSGSEQTYGLVSIGTSSILSRNTMLQATVGLGVGDDAPDYSIGIALPITFD